MKVHFTNVGRFKKSWTADLPSISERGLIASIRDHGQLMSRDIEIWFDEEGRGGKVVVGGVRVVGTFQIEGAVVMRFELEDTA